MKDKKFMDICLMCAEEPKRGCYEKHGDWVEEVFLSNVLTEEELNGATK